MKLLLNVLLCLLWPACSDAAQAAPQTEVQHSRKMQLSINNQSFSATLADTPAARELQALLPLTLTMQDHLQNEKHAELPRPLSVQSRAVGKIEAGDILLWQNRTIVVFYESFQSAYRYTRLGKIEDVAGLKQALGKGAVSIRFANE